MNQTKAVETIKMTNNETLEIHNRSRQVAANTWLVSMLFRITIDLRKIKLNPLMGITDDQVSARFGDHLIYEVKHERNFIAEDAQEKVYADIKNSFLNTNLKYLSHPEFAVKYTMKKYHEKKNY